VLVSILVTLASRIYKGGQGPLSGHDLYIILHLRQYKALQDVGYYAPSGPNLSKLCVPCSFEFLISAFPHPKPTTLGISLGGQPVKHRQGSLPPVRLRARGGGGVDERRKRLYVMYGGSSELVSWRDVKTLHREVFSVKPGPPKAAPHQLRRSTTISSGPSDCPENCGRTA
jgi:hypothetical protein